MSREANLANLAKANAVRFAKSAARRDRIYYLWDHKVPVKTIAQEVGLTPKQVYLYLNRRAREVRQPPPP